jgi:hypothetical protein
MPRRWSRTPARTGVGQVPASAADAVRTVSEIIANPSRHSHRDVRVPPSAIEPGHAVAGERVVVSRSESVDLVVVERYAHRDPVVPSGRRICHFGKSCTRDMNSLRRQLLSAACVFGVASGVTVGAQDQSPPALDAATLPPHIAEVTRAHSVLMQLIARSFAIDPRLDGLRVTFEQARDAAMLARDPQTARRIARLAEIETAYNQAMTSPGPPDVSALVREGLDLQQAVASTAEAVRSQPAVAEAADVYGRALRTAFTTLESIDPDMVRRIVAIDELVDLVSAVAMTP